MELEQMLSILVEHRIVNQTNPAAQVSSLQGDFNYLGTVYQSNSNIRDLYGNWVPQDPSEAQIRQNVTEYCILPLGSAFVRSKAPFVKSLLLYGPKGCGKTMLAQAVANHTGAVFLNLSPSNLEGKFAEKNGPAKLMHMAFAVARAPQLGPAVIYLDEVEKYFTGKKKGGDGAARFKKDLVTYANSLKPEEHVVLIGCTNQPWSIPDGELKDLRNVFEKHLYIPFASYASRVMLWKRSISALLAPTGHQLPDEFDISTLAQISEGYSAGSILHAAKRTLNTRRIERADKRPFAEGEFLSALSRCPRTYGDDNVKFRNFTAVVTGLKLRRDKLKAALAGDEGGDGKGKKGKGKKKKKK